MPRKAALVWLTCGIVPNIGGSSPDEDPAQSCVKIYMQASRRPPALPENLTWLSLTEARLLYQRLRDADQLGLQVLMALMQPDVGLGHALRDRLRRAAGLGDGGAERDQP